MFPENHPGDLAAAQRLPARSVAPWPPAPLQPGAGTLPAVFATPRVTAAHESRRLDSPLTNKSVLKLSFKNIRLEERAGRRRAAGRLAGSSPTPRRAQTRPEETRTAPRQALLPPPRKRLRSPGAAAQRRQAGDSGDGRGEGAGKREGGGTGLGRRGAERRRRPARCGRAGALGSGRTGTGAEACLGAGIRRGRRKSESEGGGVMPRLPAVGRGGTPGPGLSRRGRAIRPPSGRCGLGRCPRPLRRWWGGGATWGSRGSSRPAPQPAPLAEALGCCLRALLTSPGNFDWITAERKLPLVELCHTPAKEQPEVSWWHEIV